MQRRWRRLGAMVLTAALAVSTAVVPLSAAEDTGTAFYVDPVNGSDSAAGTVEEPFQTIDKARDTVRGLTADMTEDITVYLRGGEYLTDHTITFTSEDSGQNGHKVIYTAYEDEEPFIRGPRDITGWELYDAEKNIYSASAGGDIETRQLYVNGERAVRARSEGGLANATSDKGEFGHTTTDTFLADFNNISDMEMVYVQNWTLPRCGVQSITIGDDGLAHIEMKQPGWSNVTNKGQTSATVPWYYENAFELLDEPGEWYLNRDEDVFYYIPRLGEDMATAKVVAPTLEQLVTVVGEENDPVENLEFSGISFGYTTWLRPNSEYGMSDAQNNHIREQGSGDKLPPAAVLVQWGHGITFDSCEFSKMGINALQLIDGIQDCTVNGNEFYDISGSAINLGEPYTDDENNYNPTEEKYFIKNNRISNNYIHNVACEYMSAAAISAGFVQDSVIEHNEIFWVPYSGMHIGYGWASIPTSATKNFHIRNNYIHDIFYTELFDGGGVYTIGPTSGTVENPNTIAENYIENQSNDGGPIYNDQGSTYWSSERNVIDQSEARMWGAQRLTQPKWFKGWGKNVNYCSCLDNYTSTSQVIRDGGDYNTISGTQYCPDKNWPDEALAIIENAGVTEEYRDLVRAPQELSATEEMVLHSGDTANISLAAKGSKDAFYDLSGAEILYASEDESVATVSEDGVVTAISAGMTEIDIVVFAEGAVLRTTVPVYVDDQEVKLVITSDKNSILNGETMQIGAEAQTALGRTVELTDVAYTSDNESVVTVDETGLVTSHGVGSANLIATAEYEGETYSSTFAVRVFNYVTEEGPEFTPYPIDEMIDDVEGWNIQGSGTKTAGNGTIVLDTPSGSANYGGKTYLNEIFDFNMRIVSSEEGWPSIQFRGQSPNSTMTEASTSGYIIVFKPDYIELQRFNSGKRSVFFGTLEGMLSLVGNAYPNDAVAFGDTVHVQVGAINEEEGVRLILNIDGRRIFDYLDTSEERVEEPGYFGIVSRHGTVTLGKTTGETDIDTVGGEQPEISKSTPAIVGSTDLQDIEGHWAEREIESLVKEGIIKGVSDTEFAPDRAITRAELITLLVRWLSNCTDEEWRTHTASWGSDMCIERVKALQELYHGVLDAAGTDQWYDKLREVIEHDNLVDPGMLDADGSFDLGRPATREEMAALLYRVYDIIVKQAVVGEGTAFTDADQIAEYAQEDVRMLNKIGILRGLTETEFGPKETSTRAQAAVIVKRLIDTVDGDMMQY